MSIDLNADQLPALAEPTGYDGPLNESTNYRNGLTDASRTLVGLTDPHTAADALAAALDARKRVSFASAAYDYWSGHVDRYTQESRPPH